MVNKIMDDRTWLNRVFVAFKVYQSLYPLEQQTVDHFVRYLYREYGIVYPSGADDNGHRQ